MRVAVRNGCIVAEDKPVYEKRFYTPEEMKARLNTDEERFLWCVKHGKYDEGEYSMDLESRPYKLSLNPYYRYKQLSWVNAFAKTYSIARDESFVDEYEPLLEIYSQAYGKCWEEYRLRMTAKAEEDWENLHKDVDSSCDRCHYCSEMMDGDLYCAKYKKDLEVEIGEKVTHYGLHLMFASHGKCCEECIEARRKALEEEKAAFIDEYVNGYGWWSVERDIAVEMVKNI
jgi:hypothetical protein